MSIYQEIESILQSSSVLFICFFAILGAMIGSFFNVVILRYPAMIEHDDATEVKSWLEEKEIPFPENLKPLLVPFNISFPSSHCSSCKTPLKWYHNIPIFSFLFLKAKCGYCKEKISLQYPLVELAGGLILSLTYINYIPLGLNYFILAGILFMSLFIALCVDLKCFMLPDNINYVLMWLGIIMALNNVSLMNLDVKTSLYGAVAGYSILFIIALIGKLVLKRDAMGNGDFKLLAALGAFIGVKGVIFTVFASPFVALPWIFIILIKKDSNMLPYGPSLIIAALIFMFYGNNILSYLNIAI